MHLLTLTQLIEIWETFLLQLDTEEEDQPFLKPSVMQTEPLIPSKQQQEEARQQQQQAAATEQTGPVSTGPELNQDAHDVASRVADAIAAEED